MESSEHGSTHCVFVRVPFWYHLIEVPTNASSHEFVSQEFETLVLLLVSRCQDGDLVPEVGTKLRHVYSE